MIRIVPLLAALLAPGIGWPAPFLSSTPVLASSTQPTEYLVSVDEAAEGQSAAVVVRQVSTITITGYDAATTYKVTIGGVDVTQIGTGGTAAMTAAALTTVLNASANANFTPITWTSSAAVITGKSDVGGVAYTPTTSVTGGAGTIGAPVAVTLPTSVALFYDLEGIGFGTHTFSVKAQNATATSPAVTDTFGVGVETPEIIIIPGAP